MCFGYGSLPAFEMSNGQCRLRFESLRFKLFAKMDATA